MWANVNYLCCYLKISLKHNWVFKAKIVTMYYEVKGNKNKKVEGRNTYTKVFKLYINWCNII